MEIFGVPEENVEESVGWKRIFFMAENNDSREIIKCFFDSQMCFSLFLVSFSPNTVRTFVLLVIYGATKKTLLSLFLRHLTKLYLLKLVFRFWWILLRRYILALNKCRIYSSHQHRCAILIQWSGPNR